MCDSLLWGHNLLINHKPLAVPFLYGQTHLTKSHQPPAKSSILPLKRVRRPDVPDKGPAAGYFCFQFGIENG